MLKLYLERSASCYLKFTQRPGSHPHSPGELCQPKPVRSRQGITSQILIYLLQLTDQVWSCRRLPTLLAKQHPGRTSAGCWYPVFQAGETSGETEPLRFFHDNVRASRVRPDPAGVIQLLRRQTNTPDL